MNQVGIPARHRAVELKLYGDLAAPFLVSLSFPGHSEVCLFGYLPQLESAY